MKNRNINPEAAGQSLTTFVISPIAQLHFRLLMPVQVCLALCAAVPATVSGLQPFSGNVTARGTWTPTGDLNDGRAIHTATLLPNGLVLVAGGT